MTATQLTRAHMVCLRTPTGTCQPAEVQAASESEAARSGSPRPTSRPGRPGACLPAPSRRRNVWLGRSFLPVCHCMFQARDTPASPCASVQTRACETQCGFCGCDVWRRGPPRGGGGSGPGERMGLGYRRGFSRNIQGSPLLSQSSQRCTHTCPCCGLAGPSGHFLTRTPQG